MIITMSLVSAFASVGIMAKLSPATLRKVLHYDIVLDIAITVAFGYLMSGTMLGMCIGITTGAIISVLLFFARKFLGSISPSFQGKKFLWVEHAPDWSVSSLKRPFEGMFTVPWGQEA